jgi:hypothetical protein
MTTFTILDQAACGKKIDRIRKIGKALQNEIHVVAVSTLSHIRDHGDYTLAVRLLDALPNGQRVKALAHWYGHFSSGAATFSFDKSGGWGAKLLKARTPEMFDIEGAIETSFADLVEEKGYSTLNVAQVVAYLKRKANENGVNPDGTPKVAPEAREMLATLWVEASKLQAAAV